MRLQPCGDMSEIVRRIRKIKTMTRVKQQLLIITKRLLLRERMILKKLKCNNFPLKKIRLALTRIIIVDELPFIFVEHKGFNYYINVVEPRFPIPSRVTVANDCMKLFLNERKKLKDVLSKKGQKVCLTTDTWTSVQNLNYLCLTCHFIDSDWKYQK